MFLFAKSHFKTRVEVFFKKHEGMKETRSTMIEHGSSAAVVLSGFGVFGRESSCFVSKLVERLLRNKELNAAR